MGHYLSGLALTYAATGDARFKAKADYLVAELAKVQEAMPKQGYNKGYLSAYPESFFDRVDNSQPVWAPSSLPQDHGQPDRRVYLHRQQAGARRAEKDERVGEVPHG